MQELLIAVARGLVEDKDAVQVTVDPAREDGTVVYHLTVAEGDMGRVIGKQGRIAKAIRVVMRARRPPERKSRGGNRLIFATQHSAALRAGCFLFAAAFV